MSTPLRILTSFCSILCVNGKKETHEVQIFHFINKTFTKYLLEELQRVILLKVRMANLKYKKRKETKLE